MLLGRGGLRISTCRPTARRRAVCRGRTPSTAVKTVWKSGRPIIGWRAASRCLSWKRAGTPP